MGPGLRRDSGPRPVSSRAARRGRPFREEDRRRRCFSLFFQKKTAKRSPKAAEFLDFSKREQRNNSEASRCFSL
jgi:hypothetical protein